METTPETAALLSELYDRAAIVTELDGPQLEAWVSGLFPVFDDQMTLDAFVDYCATADTEQGALLLAAITELTTGLDPEAAAHAGQYGRPLPSWAATIGASKLSEAWSVTAKFGRSIVLGFDTPSGQDLPDTNSQPSQLAPPAESVAEEPSEAIDLRHAILAELDERGVVVDVQLTGPAKVLVDEAADEAGRVDVVEMAIDDAVAALVEGWPSAPMSAATIGAGFDANQQFVRRRIMAASGHVLAPVQIVQEPVDIRRGMSDSDYANANRAALSTLQAAIGLPNDADQTSGVARQIAAWVSVVRGDVDDVGPRERDALLWLEWADWLGAGIGLFRAGEQTEVDGAILVDFVNRCPEVSSSIDKADRDYAEWAFAVALDLLQDQGVITDDHRLSAAGYTSVRHGLAAAWS